MTHDVRKLKLAIIDDDAGKDFRSADGVVDVIQFAPHRLGLGSLVDHCRHAALNKTVEFDLCSIDINFQEDLDDPCRPHAKPSDPGEQKEPLDIQVMSASGIYHGLALLARRAPVDMGNNRLPLSWDVRSASPAAFGKSAELRNDSLRGYALLRSLLANPAPGESLEVCIRREYREAYPKRAALGGTNLLAIIEQDLEGQPVSGGLVPDILATLLPRWRHLFETAVANGHVRLHKNEMQNQLDQLLDAKGSGPSREIDMRAYKISPPNIPLRNDHGDIVGGLNLFSVMGDLVCRGLLEINEPTPKLAGALGGHRSVLQWLEALQEQRNFDPGKFRKIFMEVRNAFASRTADNVADLESLWRTYSSNPNGGDHSLILYMLMRVRLKMLGEDDSIPDRYTGAGQSDADRNANIASRYLIHTANLQTFLRPIKKNSINKSATPEFVQEHLYMALNDGCGWFVDSTHWSSWLRFELLCYCTDEKSRAGLGMSEGAVRNVAKGLLA